MLTHFTAERSYDQPSQCNFKRGADQSFRTASARCSATRRPDRGSIGSLTSEPYIWTSCNCPSKQLSRRCLYHPPKVWAAIISERNPNSQDPNFVSGLLFALLFRNLFWLNLIQVPPIIILMAKSHQACSKYDLSSVNAIFTGAAPLGAETAEELQKLYPSWRIRQGYGTNSSQL